MPELKCCKKCERDLPKNTDYYFKNKTKEDGFSNFCKECDGYSFTNKLIEVKDDYKICKDCNQELPKNKGFFHVNNERKDGLNSSCKKCVNGKNKKCFNLTEWYASKKQSFKNNWKFKDIEWLYANYLHLEKKEVLKYFNNELNYKTITNIVYQWDIRKTSKNDDWSEENMNLLIKYYPSLLQKELMEMFPDRTWHSIKFKASKLNISRSEEALFIIRSESHKGISPSLEARRKMGLKRRGENNHGWKGGASPIVPTLRDFTVPWKMDSLEAYNYKCVLSGINDGTLQVHHQNKNFSELMYETFKILNLEINQDMTKYNQDERDAIRETLLNLHYECGLGIPLTKKLHIKFHSIYGNKNNTFEQFEEFKQNYYANKEVELIG